MPKGYEDPLLKIDVLTLSHNQPRLDRFFTLNILKSVNSWIQTKVDGNIRIYFKFCIEILYPTFKFVMLFTVGAFYVPHRTRGFYWCGAGWTCHVILSPRQSLDF